MGGVAVVLLGGEYAHELPAAVAQVAELQDFLRRQGTHDGGDHLTVTGLRADTSKYVKETVSVTLRANLHYVVTEWSTGKVLFTCEKVPDPFCRCWSLGYGVTIDGKLYLLDFDANKALGAAAEKLVGKAVVVTGTLKGDVVMVTVINAVP